MRITNADRAVRLYEWMRSEGLRRPYTGHFLATRLGMTPGKNFQSVMQLVDILAHADGLGICYPLYDNGYRYSLSNDASELGQNHYHMRRVRQGAQAREVRLAQDMLANHPGDVDRFAAETTIREYQATERVRQRRLRELAARFGAGGPRI